MPARYTQESDPVAWKVFSDLVDKYRTKHPDPDAFADLCAAGIKGIDGKKLEPVDTATLIREVVHEDFRDYPQVSEIVGALGTVTRRDLKEELRDYWGRGMQNWRELTADWLNGVRYPTFWYAYANYGKRNEEGNMVASTVVKVALRKDKITVRTGIESIKDAYWEIIESLPSGLSSKAMAERIVEQAPLQIEDWHRHQVACTETLER